MKQFKVHLRCVQDVEEFVSIVTAQPFRVLIRSGSYETDGRGFMDMFCMDLNRPLEVSVECSEEEYGCFLQEVWPYLAK